MEGDVFATGEIHADKATTGQKHKVPHALGEPDMGIDNLVEAITSGTYAAWNIYADGLTIDSPTVYPEPVKVIGDLLLNVAGDVEFQRGLWVTGNIRVTTHTNMILGDDVYIEGTIIYDGNASLDVVGGHAFIIDGDVTIVGNTDLDAPGPAADLPFLISRKGSILVEGGATVAGVLYAPQDFAPALSDLAFRCCDSSDAMAIAVEGLDLALHIGDELALDYCVYNDEQETIRSVERAALGRLRSPAR